VAMKAFWGLPTAVATLPMLAASASATRNGTGFDFNSLHVLIMMGVKSNTTVSLSTSADRPPVTSIVSTRNVNWSFEYLIILSETHSKNPHSSRPATSVIMPTRRIIMSRLIASIACDGLTTPRRIMRAAPTRAAAGLSILILGNLLMDINAYVTRKTAKAIRRVPIDRQQSPSPNMNVSMEAYPKALRNGWPFKRMMIQRPRGTRDFGPAEMAKRRKVEMAMRETCARFGFGEVVTPTFEHAELFTLRSGQGIIDEMYVFKDKGDREMALRPEITASVIRFFVSELSTLPKPLKLYYVGNCFRYENPQSGRFREFFQLGAELIGAKNPETDAEVIALAVNCIRAAGLESFVVRIGHIGILKSLVHDEIKDPKVAAEVLRMVDKEDFDALGDMFDAKALPRKLFDRITALAEIKGEIELLNNLEPSETVDYLREIFSVLKLLGIDDCQVDLGIVRGLDYYTGMVFEIDAPRLGAEKQILGGGSYTLSELFGGEPVFSTGFAIGIDRVMLAVEAEREISVAPALDAYVISANDDMRKYAFGIVTRLRSQGLKADVDLMRRTMSKNLKYAASAGARYAVIVGEKEMSKRSVTLRDMKSGDQKVVLADELGVQIKKAEASKLVGH
jgi:histidyl-tRNA synthetase